MTYDLDDMDGILIGGRNVNNIRYRDDTVLLDDLEEKLQALVNRIQELREKRAKNQCK